MNTLYKTAVQITGAWLFSLFLFLTPFLSNAQTFDIDDPINGVTSDPALEYEVGVDQLKAKIINVAGFDQGNRFYFYYLYPALNIADIDQTRILQFQDYPAAEWPTGRTFSGLINETGTFNLYVSHFSGRFDHEYLFDRNDLDQSFGGELGQTSGSATATYYAGDISTLFGTPNAGSVSDCPGRLSVSIPEGATITSVDVQYNMIAAGGGWMAEQRSRIVCTSAGGISEGDFYSGSGNTGGTYSYNRAGLNIANNVVGGGDIQFEMHAFRTWGGSGCNTTYNRVENGTWTITVYYTAVPGFPINFRLSGNRLITTKSYNFSTETQGDISLTVNFDVLPSDNEPVVVEYSVNGTIWTILSDNTVDENTEFSSNLGESNPLFVLPAGAINASTSFRVRQLNSVSLAEDANTFTLAGMTINKGSVLNFEAGSLVGQYTIFEPVEPPAPVSSISLNSIEELGGGPAITPGNRVLPGEQVTLRATTQNITLDDFNYFVALNGELLDATYIKATRKDQINEELEIDIEIPVNVPDFYNESPTAKIYVVDGSEINHGIGAITNRNLVSHYADELSISGGVRDLDNISFALANNREVVTPAIEINTNLGSSLQYTVKRLSEPIPPVGTEIVVEFSVNSVDWTQLQEIPLGGVDGVGTTGETFILDEQDLAGIASTGTQFRIRQKNTDNGANIHTWKLENFILNVPASDDNIEAESNGNNLFVGKPSFTIALNSPDLEPLYPGATVNFNVENVVGTFPTGTLFEVYYGDKWLKTLSSPTNFSIVLPLDNGYKTLYLRAEIKNEVVESSVSFTIQNILLAITGVSHDFEDTGTMYNIPGKAVNVNYTMNGYVRDGTSAAIVLQIKDTDGNWETLKVEPVTSAINTNQGGIISGIIPEYNYGNTADLRIFLGNYPWDGNDYKNQNLLRNLADLTMSDDGQRNIYANNFTIKQNNRVGWHFYAEADIEQDVFLQYQLNGNWFDIDTVKMTTGDNKFFIHYANLDNFIQIPVPEGLDEYITTLRLIYNQDGAANGGLNVGYVFGLRVQVPDIVEQNPVVQTMNIIYPSVSLAQLNASYNFEEEIDIQYSTFGIDEDKELWFAITLEQNDLYYTLANSNLLGDVDLPVQFPSSEELTLLGFDIEEDFNIKVRAYSKEDYEVLMVSTLEQDIEFNNTGFLEISGYNEISGHFDLEGDRFAITRGINLSEMPEPVILRFSYEASISPVNPQTLPYLQVSNDGGESFTTLSLPESAYSDFDRLPASGTHSFSVEIPTIYLSDDTYFRWIQEVGIGTWWKISDVKILSGHSNLAEFKINFIPVSYTISLNEFVPVDPYAEYNNLNAYQWNLVDENLDEVFEPAITVGADFNYSWLVLYDANNDPVDVVWPAGTEFEFSIVLKDESNNDYDYVFATVSQADTFINQLPAFVPTGTYNIYVRAWIYDNGEKVHGFPGWVDPDALVPELNPAHLVKAGVLVINEITQDHQEIVLSNAQAVNPDPTQLDFYFGNQLKIDYEIFGAYDSNTRFGTVLEGTDFAGNMIYYNLGNQNALGLVSQTLNIPASVQLSNFDLNEDVKLKVYAYCAENAEDVFVYDAELEYALSHPMDHYLSVNNGAGNESLTFDAVEEMDGVYTKRYAVTENLAFYLGNGVVLNNHKLRFTYTETSAIAPLTNQTLPVLQISTDAGENFSNLTILFNSQSYELELTQEWLNNAGNVHFRWIQEYPAGQWALSNVEFVSGQTNWCTNIVSNAIVVNILEIPSVYPDNFTNYEFVTGAGADGNGIEPSVNVNEETSFSWSVVDVLDTDNTWPAGTKFTFTLNVEDPATLSDYQLAVLENNGIFSATIPDFVETGVYNVSVRANVGQFGEEGYHVFPSLDPWADPILVKSVLVVNQTQEDVRRIVVDLVKGTVNPELDIEEVYEITYNTYGNWPENTRFTAVIEQVDNLGNVLMQTLPGELNYIPGTLSLKMPSYIDKHVDFDHFQWKLYAYSGTEILFGQSLEVALAQSAGDGINELNFNQDGDRFALSEPIDLTGLNSAYLSFEYEADNILENQNSLPRLMVSTDGISFEPLALDAEFGNDGYLPSNGFYVFDVEIPTEYLTSATIFQFVQNVNRGDNQDAWSIDNVEVNSGDANLIGNYREENNPQEFVYNQPDVNLYEWQIVRDNQGFEPVLYSNSTFRFTWAVMNDGFGNNLGLEYPLNTTFEFFLKNYPKNGDLFPMPVNPVAGLANTFEFTLPEDIQRDNYPVLVNIAFNDYLFVDIADEIQVGTVSVFNPVLKTMYSQQEVLYAGNSASFSGEIENNVTALNPNWYYNLILTDQWGDEWLLAAQPATASFTNVVIPSFIRGNRSVEIKASMGEAMGLAGQKLAGTADVALDSDDDFTEFFASPHALAGNEGARILLSSVYQNLTGIEFVKFDVKTTSLDLTNNQKMVFEYSIDEGVTYQTIHAYPDERFTDADLNTWFEEQIEIPVEARTENTILRWRIQEFKNQFVLQNVALAYFATDYTMAPMVSHATNVTVAGQRIDIVATDALSYCSDGVVEISYHIYGKFGAENILKVESPAGTSLRVNGQDLQFTGITNGSGSVFVNFGLLDNAPSGSNIVFRLNATDETVLDYDYSVTGNLSEVAVEVIPEISENLGVYAQSLWQNGFESCAGEERLVVIQNVQENFSYQLRNYETGALLGSAVVLDTDNEDLMNPDTYPYYNTISGTLTVSLGSISSRLVVEVVAIALDETGDLECNQIVPNSQATFDVRPLYSLHYDMNNTGVWTPVASNQEFTICEGFTGLSFKMGYWKDGSFVTSSADWYRDLLSFPLGNMAFCNSFEISGTYFAVYNDGECGQYQSVSVDITVNEKPAQPVISFTGASQLCEGETVALLASGGFNYYRWFKNNVVTAGNNASLLVEETGTYTVEVSNVPFEQACYSLKSNPVYINVFAFNNVSFATSNIKLCHNSNGIAQITVNGIQEGVTYHLVDNVTGVEFGQAFSGTTWTLSFNTSPIVVNSNFSIRAVNDANSDCFKMVNTNILEVEILPPFQSLVWNGNYYEPASDASYCETATLSVGTGNGSTDLMGGSVSWYRNGLYYSAGATINLSEAGTYNALYTYQDCSYYTGEVVIEGVPERPVITYEGNLTICEGEQLVLHAPSGFENYMWYRNGTNTWNQVAGNADSLIVTISGDYRLRVSDFASCASDFSNLVKVNSISLEPVNFNLTSLYLCQSGETEINMYKPNGAVQANVKYQLVDLLSNTTIGDAFYMSGPQHSQILNITANVELGIKAVHDVATCEQMVHDNVLKVFILPVYHTLVWNENYYELSGNGSYCQNMQLSVGTADLSTNLMNGSISWYKDDFYYTNGPTLNTTEPGVYKALYTNQSNDCSYFTEEVTVGSNPATPVLTYTGLLESCEGASDLIITAPTGFASYWWFRNNTLMANISTNDNALHVVQSGNYSVVVVNEQGCESEKSLSLTAILHSKPFVPAYTVVNDVLCEPGTIHILLNTFEEDVMYQLYNAETGVATGLPRMGSANLILQSDTLSQDALLDIRAYRLDVADCFSVSIPFAIKVFNLSIIVNGNTLMASIPPSEVESYQWYRNQIMVSRGTSQSLSIYDGAQYSVEVTTINGCVLEASVGQNNQGETKTGNAVTLALYPNPVDELLNLQYISEEDDNLHVRVLSISGEVVYETTIQKTETEVVLEIPVQSLSYGSYTVHIAGQRSVKVQQFVKF